MTVVHRRWAHGRGGVAVGIFPPACSIAHHRRRLVTVPVGAPIPSGYRECRRCAGVRCELDGNALVLSTLDGFTDLLQELLA